jgi:hypothetical protein
MKKTSMAGSLGVLLVGLAVAITEVEDDIDVGPPGGAVSGFDSGHHQG